MPDGVQNGEYAAQGSVLFAFNLGKSCVRQIENGNVLYCIITIQCILARTSVFSLVYVTFWPTVLHFLAHCTSLFGPVAMNTPHTPHAPSLPPPVMDRK